MLNAPRTLEECYIMWRAKVIPEKVMVFMDTQDSLEQFYLEAEQEYDVHHVPFLAEKQLK